MEEPIQKKVPHTIKMNREKTELVNKEIKAMMEKGAITIVNHVKGEFLSNILLYIIYNILSEGIESVSSLRTLQNGRFALSKGSLAERGLYVQDRFEGCLFQRSIRQFFQEVDSFRVGWKSVRIPLSLFWSRPSPQTIYKIDENTHIYFKEGQHPSSHLSRRYANHGLFEGPSTDGKRHNSFSFATSGICNKSEKVCLYPISEDRVSGDGGGLCKVIVKFNKGKEEPHSEDLPGNIQPSDHVHFKIDQTNRVTCLNSSGSFASSITIPLSSTDSDKSTKGKEVIPGYNYPGSESKGEIIVVGEESRSHQREIVNSASSSNIDANRCLQERLGRFMPRSFNRGEVVRKGERLSHKYTGAQGSKTSTVNFHQTTERESCTLASGQYDCTFVHLEARGDREYEASRYSKRDLENYLGPKCDNHCRISSKCTECNSGLGVPQCGRSLGLEIRSNNFSESMSQTGSSFNRSVCISPMPPNTPVHGMETRSLQFEDRCNGTGMVTTSSLCVPSILINHEGVEEGRRRKGGMSDAGNTNLAYPSLVSDIVTNVNNQSFTSPIQPKSSSKSNGRTTPTGVEQISQISGVDGFRQRLVEEGVSESASNLISCSRRKSSNSNYTASWRKWTSWCAKKQIDPFQQL